MADMIHGILVLVGFVLRVLGKQLFIYSRKFVANGIKTQATVIDNIAISSQSDAGTSIMYAPSLEYDVKSEKNTYTPNSRSNPPAYDIGEKAPIVSFWGVYLGSNILFAFRLFFIQMGNYLKKTLCQNTVHFI